MAKKRESRQKSRQSDAIRGEDRREKGDRDTDRDIAGILAREWTNDRDKLRRVREYANKLIQNRGTVGEVVAQEFLAILNGTERKGEKR